MRCLSPLRLNSSRGHTMTPLRRRMIQDMQLRNFAPGTVNVYVHCVARFAGHFGKSPEALGPEDVRAFLLHLIEQRHVSWSYYNLHLQAITSSCASCGSC